MTDVTASDQVLVLDAMCLSHFARAERFDVFRDLLVAKECWTTRVVLEEMRQAVASYPALDIVFNADWLKVVELDSLDEIRRFAIWVRRLGSGERDLGEASVLAAAEPRNATSIIDDREAVRVARAHGVKVHGTLWLLADACHQSKLAEAAAGNLIDALRATGLRLPCTGAEFSTYARQHRLL